MLFFQCITTPTASSFLFQKSTEQMKKVPTIVLSVSYKGVKFIDATNKVCAITEYQLFFLTDRNTYEVGSVRAPDHRGAQICTVCFLSFFLFSPQLM